MADPTDTPITFADGMADLCDLLAGLDQLDRLLQLPTEASAAGDVEVGRFRLRRRLGCGRYGVVFLAEDPVLHRQVVVKVPQAAVLADAELRARFAQEATAAARLDHPGIIPVYDSGEYRGLIYLAAGFVDGPTLADWLATHPAPAPRVAARLVELLARALHHAHDRGVLHCDLKPANVLLESPSALEGGVSGVGTPRVTDFGLARLLDVDASPEGRRSAAGTPLYMAPEQVAGPSPNVTQRTDVYALGAILYELLSGRPPFLGDGKSDILKKAALEEPIPLRQLRPDLPRDLVAVCRCAMARNQECRYATAAELADDLGRFLSGQPVRARQYGRAERLALWARRRPEAAALVVLVVAFILAGAIETARELRQTLARNVELAATLEHEREQEQLLLATMERERSAHRRLQLRRYASVISQAADCWKGGRVDLIRGPLAELEPRPGEEDPREFAWHYLSAQVPEQVILRGHQGDVEAIAAAPSAKRFASASRDGTVVLWDAAAGNRRVNLERFPGPVHALNFSRDGSRLVAVGDDEQGGRLIRVWDARAGQLVGERREGRCAITSLALSGDGQVYYVCKRSVDVDELINWSPSDREAKVVHAARGQGFSMLEYRSDLGILAIERRRSVGKSTQYSVEQRGCGSQRKERPALTGLPDTVRLLRYSPDGSLVAVVCVDGTVVVWEVESGRERFQWRIPPNSAHQLAFSPDGQLLAVGWKDGAASRVDWWNVRSGRHGEPVRPAFPVRALTFVSEQTMAIGLGDGTIRLWSLDPHPASRELRDGGAEVWSAAFSPDGKTLASGADDALLRLWDVASQTRRAILKGHIALVMSVAYAPDGRSLVTGGFDGQVRIWDAATGASRLLKPVHTAPVTGVAVSPDGRIAVSRGRDSAIRLWELATGRLVRTLPGNRGMTGEPVFSPTGEILAIAAASDGVQLWDMKSGRLAGTIADPDYTWSVAFSPDGQTLATGSANGEVRIYDATSRELLGVLLGHEGGVRTLAFSPDGRTLATGGDDHTIRLWHAPTRQALLVLRGHRSKIFCVRFSPNGKVLASTSHDGTIRLWQAGS